MGGFFYKLRKDEPQDIIYTVDYQTDVNEEYFHIFKEAGWNNVISLGNQTHIFSAKVGTRPIYSDLQSNLDKYILVKNKSGKAALYSLILGILLMSLLFLHIEFIKSIAIIIEGLLLVDYIVFVFTFVPIS